MELDKFIATACEPEYIHVGRSDVPSGMPLSERLALFGVVQALAPRASLEIGSWCGASLVFIAYASQRTVAVDARIAIEGIDDSLAICREFCEKCGVAERIEHVAMTSDRFFETCDGTFDFIHIDGNHEYEYAKRDLQNSLKRLDPGGVVAMHDARRPEIQAAIRDVITPYHQMMILNRHSGIAFIQENRAYLRSPLVQSLARRVPEGVIQFVRRMRAQRR